MVGSQRSGIRNDCVDAIINICVRNLVFPPYTLPGEVVVSGCFISAQFAGLLPSINHNLDSNSGIGFRFYGRRIPADGHCRPDENETRWSHTQYPQ